MTSYTKNDKHHKSSINCAFGDQCSRRKCLFKHPDGWNYLANQQKIRQEQRKQHDDLQQQRRDRLLARCQHGDLCHRIDCPFQHSPHWDPQRNQQLAENKRRRDEQRKEEQRKHAYEVSIKQTGEAQFKLDTCQSQNKSLQRNLIDEEYEYDNEYFDIQEKIWEKQSSRYNY